MQETETSEAARFKIPDLYRSFRMAVLRFQTALLLVKNETLKSSTFPNHTFYAKSLGLDSTFWQEAATFREMGTRGFLGLLRTVAILPLSRCINMLAHNICFRHKVGGKELLFRFFDANLPPNR